MHPPVIIAITVADFISSSSSRIISDSSCASNDRSRSPLMADANFDVWSLGCILFQLCNPCGMSLFVHNKINDNLSCADKDEDNFGTLAEWSDQVKEKKLHQIEDIQANALLKNILKKDTPQEKRLQNYICPLIQFILKWRI